jgi:hypothetical protein
MTKSLWKTLHMTISPVTETHVTVKPTYRSHVSQGTELQGSFLEVSDMLIFYLPSTCIKSASDASVLVLEIKTLGIENSTGYESVGTAQQGVAVRNFRSTWKHTACHSNITASDA